MSVRTSDVLIVGAGPVGLTMAAVLVQHGLRCRIIDKAPQPSDKSKALAVWCRTMELLDGLDLAEAFVATGLKLTGGSIYAEGSRIVHLKLTSDESPFGFPLMIPQSETERLLTEHLARQGVIVERPVELVAFADETNAVVCAMRHADGREERLDVPWLIGCDGAHSTVRHLLGMQFTGQAEPNDWMLADVRIDGPLAADEVSVFWAEEGVLAFFPMRRDRFRMVADLGAAMEGTRSSPTLAEAQARVDERGPGGLALSEPHWLANFRINERKVRDYRRGRVMLAGDAAHIHSPTGGQGMNTGMQDAFNLAWKLALVHRGQGLAEPLLESYSIERSAVADQVLRSSGRFTTLATLRHAAAQWLRNHIAPIVTSFEFVQRRIRNEWFELSINYRHSPLVAERWPLMAGGLAAGDRLADATLASAADGRITTLFAALRDTRHALLLLPGERGREAMAPLRAIATDAVLTFPGVLGPHVVLRPDVAMPSMPAANTPTWIDTTGRLHKVLGASEPTLVLARPDGYIGFRAQPADGAALLNHLASHLARRR